MITLQYLEPGPHIADITPQQAQEKLRSAFARLPVDCLLLGWDLPRALADVCRDEAALAGAKLYRWHPLLTGDGDFYPKETWRTRNFSGVTLPGFRSLPEFTFVCPNHPAVREAALAHLSKLTQTGTYDGFFLDRMRFPSPTGDPLNALACFCEHCQSAAADFGLDLVEVHQYLQTTSKHSLFDSLFTISSDVTPLTAFLDFRQQAITAFLYSAIEIVRSADLEVGLDCFSPSLTRVVGQDLAALVPLADWAKLMIYGHARGPATLPYEIGALIDWLMDGGDFSEKEALAYISKNFEMPLPACRARLRETGFASQILAAEFECGRLSALSSRLLAGIELVEMPGVSELNIVQIEADLRAFKAAGVDGLSLSWDLWHMPLERLHLVTQVWG